MRLDKFLKISRIIKRRTVANEACDTEHVSVNGRRAKASYDAYLTEGLSHPIPFKGTGLAHIRFAKDEPLLFRFLFVESGEADPLRHYLPSDCENERMVRNTVESGYGYTTEEAKHLYNHLSVYVHGLAMLYAYGHAVFDEGDVDRMLTEVFLALKDKMEAKNQ